MVGVDDLLERVPPVDDCTELADVLGVVRLPAPDVQSYLTRAVEFANEALAGSLGATLLVDPETEAHHRQARPSAIWVATPALRGR